MEYLASLGVRTLVLAALAWMVMAACRVKSPAARHAVWTVVVAGMLAIAAAAALLPPLKVSVLRAAATARVASAIALPARSTAMPAPLPESQRFPWERAAGAIYIGGLLLCAIRLAYGYLLTRRLVHASRPVTQFGEGICESECIHVPLTVGVFRPKILLPAGWDTWDAGKLEAVLVHERTHVRRADWAIAAMAGVNRCVFWFHPLAWWLTRQLAMLAEQACDDASLAQVSSRECYAETLLAMAAAVREDEGRVAWEAMAMAKKTEVRLRVERILDEGRRIWPGMTRARWLALAVCGLPLVYLSAVVRPARVRAQTQDAPPMAARAQEAPREPQETERAPLRRQREELREAQARLREQELELERQAQLHEAQIHEAQIHQIQIHEADLALQHEQAMLELQAAEQQKALAGGNDRQEEVRRRITALQWEIERMAEQLTDNHPQLRRAEAARAELQSRLEQLEREARGRERERFTATAPKLLLRHDPEYTPEAKAARTQGSVELSVTIDEDGAVSDAKVVRSLPTGLDQKAIECVKQWRFAPATRNGEPVTAFASVEVKFRLD